MSKKEVKELFRVLRCRPSDIQPIPLFHGIDSYDKAIQIALSEPTLENFKIEKYYQVVEVQPVYEYIVCYKNIKNEIHVTTNQYFVSKDEFLSTYLSLKFICLIEETKRERT